MTSSIGVVSKLFCRMSKNVPEIEMVQLRLKAGRGIEGDIHANPVSPRQILIVRQENLSKGSLGYGPIEDVQPGRFGENLVVTGISGSEFVPGARLEFAGGAAIRLTFYCEPCKKIAGLVWELKDVEQKRGILGVVVQDGVLRAGEDFKIQAGVFTALSEIPYQRFLGFLAQVPAGKVVTYSSVLVGIGVDRGYLRAIPGYLRKAAAAGYPAHRVLDSKGYLTAYVDDQSDRLLAEGIEVMKDADKLWVSIDKYLWSSSYF
jgi:MOSC domain-containing protein YiiM/alkylated DNA nucleotide flippase Atl1